MKLITIEKNAVEALQYLERCVNNGLPGGTRFLNNVSPMYNPWLNSSFMCDTVIVNSDRVIEIGDSSDIPPDILREEFYIHPDTMFIYPKHDITLNQKRHRVLPTSSARTVYIPELNYYVKLHYPLMLGRVNKALSKNDLMNSYYNTFFLSQLISEKKCSPNIGFFPEPYAKYSPEYNLFNIWRSPNYKMLQNHKDRVSYIIPAFSLFGRDWENPDDPTLIFQLIVNKIGIGKEPMNLLVFPIISCYLSLLFQCGLQIEMHAQNFMIAFDINWNFIGIILRDIDSIQHDLTIMQFHGFNYYAFQNYGRCLDDSDDYYKIKHSFMFDHKFGEFFLLPLLSEIRRVLDVDMIELTEEIKCFCRLQYGDEFEKYFPENVWYKFENILIRPGIRRRVYTKCSAPIFR